eukprot:SAG31_NODE_26995_length_433_cov_0.571856_1_plen_82_part_01
MVSLLRLYLVYSQLSDDDPTNNDNPDQYLCVWNVFCVSGMCIGIFCVEMVAKWLAFGFAGYWSSPWNFFDGFCTVSTLLAAM